MKISAIRNSHKPGVREKGKVFKEVDLRELKLGPIIRELSMSRQQVTVLSFLITKSIDLLSNKIRIKAC